MQLQHIPGNIEKAKKAALKSLVGLTTNAPLPNIFYSPRIITNDIPPDGYSYGAINPLDLPSLFLDYIREGLVLETGIWRGKSPVIVRGYLANLNKKEKLDKITSE